MGQASAVLPREQVVRAFRDFARIECPGSAPLYERLSYAVAEDEEMLTLAAFARVGQPIPNMLFAAVHYLLLGGVRHPLALFYPDLAEAAVDMGDPFPAFRAFCREHAETISTLLRTRRVQTNEVRRCACLLPAFAMIAERAPSRPLALVEVGTSAGLNLFWDRYRYDYGAAGTYGDEASPVALRCEMRGSGHFPVIGQLPRVVTRIGIDLHPVDARDADEVLWLRALIWPEHTERVELLRRALEVVRREPPEMTAGDALAVLPDALGRIPEGAKLCVFHSLTLNQFSREGRARFADMLAEEARRRPIFEVSLEYRQREGPLQLDVVRYADGERAQETQLARCQPHGKWLGWV